MFATCALILCTNLQVESAFLLFKIGELSLLVTFHSYLSKDKLKLYQPIKDWWTKYCPSKERWEPLSKIIVCQKTMWHPLSKLNNAGFLPNSLTSVLILTINSLMITTVQKHIVETPWFSKCFSLSVSLLQQLEGYFLVEFRNEFFSGQKAWKLIFSSTATFQASSSPKLKWVLYPRLNSRLYNYLFL